MIGFERVKQMSIEELIAEMNKQYEIASDAECRAENCRATAVQKFLEENHLDKIVLHKRTNTKGVLHRSYDFGGVAIDFYPLKENGEESSKRSVECSAWYGCYEFHEALERLKECYEPCDMV